MQHHFSIVHPNAKIGENVTIGPFVEIREDVEIGDGTILESNVSIMDGVKIGRNGHIFPGAILGAIPQDKKFGGEQTILEIGNNVTIREYCTINKGTISSGKTVIKDNALLMAYTHVAHDCIIGKNAILANNVNLAGHVDIGDFAILGGLVAVHQFVKIGAFSMIGGGSLVRKDVPPFIKAAREPLSYIGVNSIGLERAGFSKETINQIQDIYRILFVKGFNTRQAKVHIGETIPGSAEKEAILTFLEAADRGIIKGFRNLN
jgi:UDP-N-acetylglucosamine acyltransferase